MPEAATDKLTGSGGEMKARQAWRFVASRAALVGWVLLSAFGLFLFLYPSGDAEYVFDFLGAVVLIAGFVMCALAFYLNLTWTSLSQSQTFLEAVSSDKRPTILYLRPFKADKVRFSTLGSRVKQLKALIAMLGTNWPMRLWNGDLAFRSPRAEQLLIDVLDSLGPVVAIGRPGESIPPLGAARVYLGSEWKNVVQDLLKKSQMILMFAGTTHHFGWEIREVFRNDPFVPMILFLPFFRKYRQSEVDEFIQLFKDASGFELSPNLESATAVYFPERSKMVEIWGSSGEDEDELIAMNPFLGAIAQVMEMSRPGWSAPYIRDAREDNRTNRRWLFIGGPIVLLYVLWTLWRALF